VVPLEFWYIKPTTHSSNREPFFMAPPTQYTPMTPGAQQIVHPSNFGRPQSHNVGVSDNNVAYLCLQPIGARCAQGYRCVSARQELAHLTFWLSDITGSIKLTVYGPEMPAVTNRPTFQSCNSNRIQGYPCERCGTYCDHGCWMTAPTPPQQQPYRSSSTSIPW